MKRSKITHPTQTFSFLKRPYVVLTSLILLFIIPLLVAFWMLNEKGTLSLSTVQHGQLIQPPLDLAHLSMKNAKGESVDPAIWKGKWLLLFVNPHKTCSADCEKKLYDIRQIKTATGKNSQRIERAILMFSDAPADEHLQTLLNTSFAGTAYFSTTRQDFIYFIDTNVHTKLAFNTSNIYLVDPLGNVMMVYSEDAQPMGILKDLTRLLKLSHIG